jgi:hypothetical protein
MLDPKVSELLVLNDATKACEHPGDLVHIEVIGTGHHLRRARREAEITIERFPDMYRTADGPDDIDDEREPWELYNDDGLLIDTNGSLRDPELSDEDRERISDYRSSTTAAERRANRKALFAQIRSVQ